MCYPLLQSEHTVLASMRGVHVQLASCRLQRKITTCKTPNACAMLCTCQLKAAEAILGDDEALAAVCNLAVPAERRHEQPVTTRAQLPHYPLIGSLSQRLPSCHTSTSLLLPGIML